MKSKKSISLFFAIGISACLLLTLGFLMGVKTMTDQSDKVRIELYGGMESDAPQFGQVSRVDGVLRSDTEFVVEEYELRTEESTRESLALPPKYVGMDLNDFMDAVEQYNQAPPLSEREKGFSYLEVLRFSGDRVMVRKNYVRALPKEGYFLALKDSRVVVFLEDGRTVYMTTDISDVMLPQSLREELVNMIYVEDEAELYDFLEAYSS